MPLDFSTFLFYFSKFYFSNKTSVYSFTINVEVNSKWCLECSLLYVIENMRNREDYNNILRETTVY